MGETREDPFIKLFLSAYERDSWADADCKKPDAIDRTKPAVDQSMLRISWEYVGLNLGDCPNIWCIGPVQERKAAYNQAKEDAMYTQLLQGGANTFDPGLHFVAPDQHGGFVYSLDEIKLALQRVARLEEARARFVR